MLANVLRKRTPCAASRSRFGVRTSGLPMQPRAWPRHWSGTISRTLGRRPGAASESTLPAADAGLSRNPTAAPITRASQAGDRLIPVASLHLGIGRTLRLAGTSPSRGIHGRGHSPVSYRESRGSARTRGGEMGRNVLNGRAPRRADEAIEKLRGTGGDGEVTTPRWPWPPGSSWCSPGRGRPDPRVLPGPAAGR